MKTASTHIIHSLHYFSILKFHCADMEIKRKTSFLFEVAFIKAYKFRSKPQFFANMLQCNFYVKHVTDRILSVIDIDFYS